jgi:hypothetical protein
MTPRRWLLRSLGPIAVIGVIPVAKAADPLGKPTGKVILTVSGKIKNTNRGDVAEFDREMLEALGMASIQTGTPWYAGVVTFEGVPMAKLLEAVGAFGTDVTALALNDYSTTIPVSDFGTYKVILALKRNGNYMPVSDKGPLFIIYPFDSDAELRQQKYYSRAAWQVSRLVVK